MPEKEDYGARVGDIGHVDAVSQQNELNRLAPTAGALPDKATLAPTLVDRGPQRNPLIERLDAMVERRETRALLVVVPGCRDDLHQALVVRCALVDFLEPYGGLGAWRYLKRLEWPEGSTTVEGILRTVRDATGMPKTYKQADIENGIKGLDRHVCFSHSVDEQNWDEDGGALIKRWVDYFAQGKLETPPGQLVVAFLCVELAEDMGKCTSACRQLGAYIDELRAREDGGGGVMVTPPLGLIRSKHLVEWAAKISEYLEDDTMEAALADLPAAAFTQDVTLRRLGDVYGSMRSALDRALRRRTRFVEGRA